MTNDNNILTKKQFLRKHISENIRGAIYGSSLLLYINAIFTFALVLSGNLWSIVDCLVIVVLVTIIIKCLSCIAAVIVLIYSVVNTIIMTVYTGQLGGWLIIIPSVALCICLFYLDKKYKGYLSVKKEEL